MKDLSLRKYFGEQTLFLGLKYLNQLLKLKDTKKTSRELQLHHLREGMEKQLEQLMLQSEAF